MMICFASQIEGFSFSKVLLKLLDARYFSEYFPGGAVVKNLPANARDTKTWVQSLVQEYALD